MKYETTGGVRMDTMDKLIPMKIVGPDIDESIDILLDFDDVPHGHVAQALDELEYLFTRHGWKISNR